MATTAFPQECDIVATLSPKDGKLDRVIFLNFEQ